MHLSEVGHLLMQLINLSIEGSKFLRHFCFVLVGLGGLQALSPLLLLIACLIENGSAHLAAFNLHQRTTCATFVDEHLA